jgi:hypothetical protein
MFKINISRKDIEQYEKEYTNKLNKMSPEKDKEKNKN